MKTFKLAFYASLSFAMIGIMFHELGISWGWGGLGLWMIGVTTGRLVGPEPRSATPPTTNH